MEGYEAIDPSHPLGGQDGLKDIVCAKDGVKSTGAKLTYKRTLPLVQ